MCLSRERVMRGHMDMIWALHNPEASTWTLTCLGDLDLAAVRTGERGPSKSENPRATFRRGRTTVILRFGNHSSLWSWYFFFDVDLTSTFVRRVLPNCIEWRQKKNMIQILKCSNCRFIFKFGPIIIFLWINEQNMQISCSVLTRCCTHTHTSYFLRSGTSTMAPEHAHWIATGALP